MHINFWSRSMTLRALSLALITLAMSAGALGAVQSIDHDRPPGSAGV